jgi:hypothetical protein
MTLGTIFLVVALVCFLLAAFNVAVKKVSLIGLGLAFLTLAMLLTESGLKLR